MNLQLPMPGTMVILLLLLLACRLAGQDGAGSTPSVIPGMERINRLVAQQKYKQAIDLSLGRAAEMKKLGNTEQYITFTLRAAEIETFEVWKGKGTRSTDILPDYRRPFRYLKSLQEEAGTTLDEYPALKADVLFTRAVVYHWLDMPDIAEDLHEQALTMRRELYGDSSREVADSYLWRGVLYNLGLQRKDLAEENYVRARELQKKFLPESRYALGSACFGLAGIAMEKFQFDEALVLANQYMSLYSDLPYEQAFGLQLIANVYWNMRDFENSLRYRYQAIELYKRSRFREDLIMEYSNLANDLSSLGNYSEAEAVLKEGERILQGSERQNAWYSLMLFATFGSLYGDMKDYAASERYFSTAMNIAVRQYGARNDAVADIHRMRGDMYKRPGTYEEALKDYHRILLAVIPDFSAQDYKALPGLQYESPYFRNIIAATFRKGDALLEWALAGGDTLLLRLAMDNYRHAYAQMILARNSIGDELSKTYLLINHRESIESSLQCAHALFTNTGRRKYLDDLFNFIEFTKYLNVLDALHRADRANNSEVPVDLLLRLRDVRSELNRLQRIELSGEHFTLSVDSLSRLRDTIVNLIQDRKVLIEEINRHSASASLAHGTMLRSLGAVQAQLDNDEQILEYYWGNGKIYVMSITSTTAEVAALPRDPGTDTLLFRVDGMLNGRPAYRPADVAEYGAQTTMLYDKLFKPFLRRRKPVIIPDGILQRIPLEALVTGRDARAKTYRQLAYAVSDYEISYAYSASILFNRERRPARAIESVLAFAYQSDEEPPSRERTDGPSSLPGTLREIEMLSILFPKVSRFTGKDAVRSNFTRHLDGHDLVHLGIHGVGDAEIADHARLVFRPDSMTTGALYAYEIYNMSLNASLVVLSACETGIGKHQEGEGMLSMARAFIYAGCPSVVMSLWKVNDLHTATLMEGFYSRLRNGQRISAALRDAKLRFLRRADRFAAHPSNWAALVLNGQDQSFDRSSPYGLLHIVGILVLLLTWIAWKHRSNA